ncbi:eEF1A lysine and N-terminal methyltransferase-like [Haliotis cracherodii]|uniref:eEF1A lysine and N-terminal methyltransferase-like n=1 Tax=Haliotis cracherodii TaxID=6455 RepID=UPI0039EA561A
MDLLPRSHTEFVSEEYWDKFYKKRGAKAFEWYGEYPELCGVLGKYVRPKDKVLMVGCGNSRLSEDMYDVGYTNIVNIDISDTVIRQMTDKNRKQRPNMAFHRMDVTETTFSDGEFSVALDKGTLDALMADSSDAVVATVDKMFAELSRVLRLGGRYICISLLQEHIANKLFSYFAQLGWPVRVHRVEKEPSQDDPDFTLPAFVIILTKFKKMPNMCPILEVCNAVDKMDRYEDVQGMKTVVKEMQYYAVVKHQISTKNVGGDQPSLCLYSSESSEPRYTLYVVDRPHKTAQQFAVFIVPQGRETDWLFCQPAGRKQLADSAGSDRLVVVTLHRSHCYTDIESVKEELSGKVMELTPPNFKRGSQVPFLSLGEDIGHRHSYAQGTSEMNGKYVVEDLETEDGQFYRRLIFLDTANIVQSEAKLVEKSANKGSLKGYDASKLTLDKSFLGCQHHMAMVGSLAFLPQPTDREMSVLLIGLGGGGLSSFIHHHFHKVRQDVVDFDPDVLDVAEKHFFLKQDDRLQVHIADGLEFIHKAAEAGRQYDVVMFDVDSKDRSVGISCPPVMFLEEAFLQETASIIRDKGVFALNLVARDDILKKNILARIKKLFGRVLSVHIDDEVNEIVFCLRGQDDGEQLVADAKSVAATLNKVIKVTSAATEVDISEALETLSLVDESKL